METVDQFARQLRRSFINMVEHRQLAEMVGKLAFADRVSVLTRLIELSPRRRYAVSQFVDDYFPEEYIVVEILTRHPMGVSPGQSLRELGIVHQFADSIHEDQYRELVEQLIQDASRIDWFIYSRGILREALDNLVMYRAVAPRRDYQELLREIVEALIDQGYTGWSRRLADVLFDDLPPDLNYEIGRCLW